MKKYFSLILSLVLLIVGAGTASAADVPQLSTEGDMHYYTIKTTRGATYVKWVSDATYLATSKTVAGLDNVFYFTAGTTTSFTNADEVVKIHNCATTNLMAGFDSWTTDGADWYIKAGEYNSTAGIWFSTADDFSTSSFTCWNRYNESKIGSWYAEGDEGSHFTFTEISLNDAKAPTAKEAYDNAKSLTAGTGLFQPNADAISAMVTAYETYAAISSPTEDDINTVNAAAETYYANRYNAPSDGTLAILNSKAYSARYVYTDGTSMLTGTDYTSDYAKYVFKFIKSGNSWKIYSTNANKYVGPVPTADNTLFTLVESADDAGEFTICDDASTGYVRIYNPSLTYSSAGASSYVNGFHSAAGQDYSIVRWEDADASRFKFIILPTDDELSALLETAKSFESNNTMSSTTVGEISKAFYDKLYSNFRNNKTYFTYNALKSFIESPFKNAVDVTKYYTIENVATSGIYLQETYDGTTASLAATTKPSNEIATLLKFEQATDKEGYETNYRIQTANSKKYFSLTLWSDNGSNNPKLVEIADAAPYDLTNTDYIVSGKDGITLTYWKDAAHSDRGTLNYSSGLGSWNAASNGTNMWKLTEVTTIPVSISAAKYATICAPVALTIPEGVQAWIATGLDNTTSEFALQEVSGTIPAETPVILTGNEGSYTFAIDYTNTDAATTGNSLLGTTAPKDITTGNTGYVLKNGTNGVGMYPVNGTTTVSANKAYYETTDGATSIGFNFGNVTAINNATSNNAAANAYYDLNGRRVLYPAAGVYVKNGKKVLVK